MEIVWDYLLSTLLIHLFALNIKILLYLHTFSYENNKMNAFVEKVGSTETNEENRRTYTLDIKRRAYP